MHTQATGVPGRAPGPHASRPRIADTMQRVVGCAVVARNFVKKFSPETLGEFVKILGEEIGYPGREPRQNCIRGCEKWAGRVLDAVETEVEAEVRRNGGRVRRDGEEYVEYLTSAIEDLKVRGARRAAVLEKMKRGLAACETRDAIERGELREKLERVWRDELESISIDQVIEQLKRRGVDGEALCWEVIGRESMNHVLLVKREANRMVRMWPERKADDLVGYGWRGLRLALRSYRPETAWFSTYACPKIRGSIRDGVRNEHHLPKRLNTFVNKLERARDELGAALGRHPTHAEIAEKLEIELERVQMLPVYAMPQSLQHGEEEHGIQILGEEDVEEAAMRNFEKERIAAALGSLPSEEAEAVRLLVMEQLSMGEARERTGASPKQLRARRDRGLASLREDLG
jgi:RNA polymerase sigma factor for flagellar operon FliA